MNSFLPQNIFSLNGRIGRAQFWAGLALIISVGFLLTRLVEGSFVPETPAFPKFDAATTWVGLGLEVILVFARFRDLNWPRWLGAILVAATNCYGILLPLMAIPDGSMASSALMWITGIALAAEVVACGMLPGKASGGRTHQAQVAA